MTPPLRHRSSATLAGRRPRYVLALLSSILPVAAASAQAQSTIERELWAALASRPHTSTVVGACVVDLSSQTTVYAYNAEAPLLPASNMKVFVMAAALTELGSDFAFETVLATDGVNLYVIGDGDPAFGDGKLCRSRGDTITTVFERWASALPESWNGMVSGDIIIDESIFESQWTHPSWEETDLDNWYAAPVAGLNYNDNCVDITVSPASGEAVLAVVTVRPETSLVQIINKCRSGGTRAPVLHHPHDSFLYRLSGGCRKRWPFGPVSFPDPGLLLADSFRTVLTQRGIRVTGSIRRERVRLPHGTLPESLSVLDRHRTPIADVLRRAGKDSQNLFAECLLKRTGYAWARRKGRTDPQGSWAPGAEAIVDVLEHAGVETTGLVVADGSGLSRDNRCTARQLVSVLALMHQDRRAELFRDSLSVAGVDGSLRKRLADVAGRVRGKTGTMRGVRTLSGFVDSDSSGPYAFALLFNGYQGPSTPYAQVQDRFCRVLARGVR